MLRLLKDTFDRLHEGLIHGLKVKPEHIDPVTDVFEFAFLTNTPAWKEIVE